VGGKTDRPIYVVTVLRQQQPIAIISSTAGGPTSNDVEVFYKDSDTLDQVQSILHEALHSVNYLLWKETGILPAPPDYTPPTESSELPF